MFELFEEVRIKKNGVPGTIVDISDNTENPLYMVESSIEGPLEGGYGELWPLFDVYGDEIEKLPEDKQE